MDFLKIFYSVFDMTQKNHNSYFARDQRQINKHYKTRIDYYENRRKKIKKEKENTKAKT